MKINFIPIHTPYNGVEPEHLNMYDAVNMIASYNRGLIAVMRDNKNSPFALLVVPPEQKEVTLQIPAKWLAVQDSCLTLLSPDRERIFIRMIHGNVQNIY